MVKLSESGASEVAKFAQKAAPHRIEITEVLNKKIKYLRQSFVLPFVQHINKKKDKEEYVAVKVEQEKIFRKIKDYMYYEGQDAPNSNGELPNKLDKLLSEVNSVVQYLRYINHVENLNNLLATYGMTITCKDLSSVHAALSDEVTKDNIQKIFESASKVQASIQLESSKIKNVIFEELPEEIKYDSKTNKSGLKSNEFDRITSLEATKQKSEELAEKKLETLKDSIVDSIDSKINVQVAAQKVLE